MLNNIMHKNLLLPCQNVHSNACSFKLSQNHENITISIRPCHLNFIDATQNKFKILSSLDKFAPLHTSAAAHMAHSSKKNKVARLCVSILIEVFEETLELAIHRYENVLNIYLAISYCKLCSFLTHSTETNFYDCIRTLVTRFMLASAIDDCF